MLSQANQNRAQTDPNTRKATRNMNTETLARQHRFIPFLLLVFAGLILVNCAATKPKPGFHHKQDGKLDMFKRFEQVIDRDLLHHWSRHAYFIPRDKMSLVKEGEAASEIIEIWGRPDWIRRPFESNSGDKVHEWIYLDLNQMFQFVDGMLVYEGPVTDFEQTLIRRGYPQRAMTLRESNGKVITILIYTKIWGSRIDQYRFVNGMLSFQEEGI